MALAIAGLVGGSAAGTCTWVHVRIISIHQKYRLRPLNGIAIVARLKLHTRPRAKGLSRRGCPLWLVLL